MLCSLQTLAHNAQTYVGQNTVLSQKLCFVFIHNMHCAMKYRMFDTSANEHLQEVQPSLSLEKFYCPQAI